MGVKVRERPKGSGVFWIFIDHNNRRKAKKIGTDEKLANEVAEKIQARLTLGDLDLLNEAENSTPDFEEYANCWLEDYIKPLRRNTTYERYGDLLKRYVYPVLGKKPIHEIKRVTTDLIPIQFQRFNSPPFPTV